MLAKQTAKTLLIVEPQMATREALASVFRSEGFQVVTAVNSHEAVGHIRGPTPPNVVLLDFRDREGDDARFLESRLHDSVLAAVPVVLMTETKADADWLAGLRVAGAFRKPVPLDPLISLVRNFE